MLQRGCPVCRHGARMPLRRGASAAFGRQPAAFKHGYDAVAGVFYQVEGKLEAVGTAVIRVGHGVVSGMARHEVGGAHQPGAFFASACQTRESLHVVGVHAEDDVEAREVLAPYLPRYAVYAVAAARPVAAHPAVGQLPLVPRAYACRVNVDAGEALALFFEFLFHYGLGGRRAADVAEADKEKVHVGMKNEKLRMKN